MSCGWRLAIRKLVTMGAGDLLRDPVIGRKIDAPREKVLGGLVGGTANETGQTSVKYRRACDSPSRGATAPKALEAVSLALKVWAQVAMSIGVFHTGRAHYYYLTLPRNQGSDLEGKRLAPSRPQRT